MLILIILQALYACVSITNKTLLGYCNPLVFACMRMAFSSFVLAVYATRNTSILSHISFKYAPYYVYLIVCGVYAKYALKYWGLHSMSAIKMSCLFHCTPFIMAGISWMWDGERISRWQLCGLLLGFLAMMLLLFCNQGTDTVCLQEVGLAELAVVLAIIIECVHIRIKKILVHEKNHSPFGLSLLTHGCAGFLSLVTIWGLSYELPVRSDVTFYGLFIISAVLGTIVCNNLYIWLLKTYSTTMMTYSDYLLTLFIALFSWVLFAQQPPWHLSISIFMTFGGLYCLLQSTKTK